MSKEQIAIQGQSDGLKSFIIGKLWITSTDGQRPGSLRISRTLPKDMVLTKGTVLSMHLNKKREGKQDADYTVSVRLPEAQADELIALEKAERAKLAVNA